MNHALLDDAAARRQQRYDSFARFKSNVDVWSEWALHNHSNPLRYNFRVLQKFAGADEWQVDLVGDKRKVAFRRSRKSFLYREVELEGILESGARLLYEMTDEGKVWCCIYGYRTPYSWAKEGMIMLASKYDPGRLAENGIPRDHWRAFQAYMRVTCIDDVDTWQDRLYVRWLRWSRPLLDDERKVVRARYSILGLKISNWLVITILAASISVITQTLLKIFLG